MTYTLITGASKGIGKAFAYECAAKGMNLILVARSEQLLADLAKDLLSRYTIQVHFLAADLIAADGPTKVFEWLKSKQFDVDMLINNAGMGFHGKFEEQPLSKHLEVMHLNMDSMVCMAHEFLNNSNPQVKRYILNVVSMGAFTPIPYMAIYGASKAFMLSFSKALRYELKKQNVFVSALCPGGVATEFFGPAQMDSIAKKTANLMSSAEDVARQGLAGVLSNKAVVVPGFINRVGTTLMGFAPESIVLAQTGKMYKPD